MKSSPLTGLGPAFSSEGATSARSEAAPQAQALTHAAQTPDLRELFQLHYATIWRLLRRFGVAQAELDDAAQEVFWVAARRLSDLQPGREMAFLYGVALRVASNSVRRAKVAASKTDPDALEAVLDPRPSPEEQLDQQQARQLLDEVLARMPLELRTAFVLFELEGLSVSDVAELEGLPLGTASSRLRRARAEFSAISKRLRAALAARGVPR